MTDLRALLLYVPICIVVLLVLEVCKTDDAKRAAKRTLANFGVLTLVLGVASVVVFFINKHL
jgi:hypothetical protein